MLPPIMNNISSEILTLYTSRNRNEGDGTEGTMIHTTRARYAEIGVKRNDVFLEPYLQHQHEYQHHQQQEHDNISVQSLNSPKTPPFDPLQQQLGQLHHVQSEDSLISESSDTSGSTSSHSTTEEDSSSEVTCNINLIERLIRSHPVWFLPGIQRAGAFHLLQGKEEGNFVVRQSSQSDTMALSVRLPPGKGPYIEHYLIQADKGKLSLETSENIFDNIPSLIAHYSQCCDELPVQLTLPKAMREAKNRQQLSSLALLGQEFWRYPMANSKSAESSGSNSNISSLSSFHTGNNNNNRNSSNNNNHHHNHKNNLSASAMESIVLNLTPISTKEPENTASINTKTTLTFTTLEPRLPRPKPPNTLNLTTFNELLDINRENKLSPNDKLSQRLISPNLVQNFVKSSSPLVHNIESYVASPTNNLNSSCELMKVNKFNANNSLIASNFHRNIANGSHKLATKASPNIIQTTTDEYDSKSPPPPPPRWAKPGQQIHETTQKNLSITTSTTFTANQNCDSGIIQSTPSDGNTPLLLSPQSAYSNKSLSSNPSSNKSSSTNSSSSILSPTPVLLSVSSKLTNGIHTSQILSPISVTPSGTNKISRRRKEKDARKNSQHYQESDIMESYCRSSPADKISDYEDIWNTADHSNPSTWSQKNSVLTDIIDEATKEQINECGNKILNPIVVQYSPSELNKNEQQQRLTITSDKLIIRNDKTCANEKLSYKKVTSPEFSSFKPLQDIRNLKTTSTPKVSIVCSRSPIDKSLDLVSPCNNSSHVLNCSENNSSAASETKQSNTFYAEPADAIPRPIIGIVARRRPKTLNKVTNRFRHSEPSWLQTQFIDNCNLEVITSHPSDWDDSEETEDKTPLISSSMDNLAERLNAKEQKKCLPSVNKPVQPPKIKPRMFKDTSWTIDSSWEFIGHDANECELDCDYDVDYDSNYVGQNFPDEEQDKYILRNTLTAQSIILQRYPDLIIQSDIAESLYSDRNSSYDNVEKRQERVCQTTGTTNMKSTVDSKQNRIRGLPESEAILNTNNNNNDSERRNKSFKERIDPLLSPPRLQVLRNRENSSDSGVTGLAIRTYAFQLASDKTTTFSQNIENFIQCTKDSKEASPHIVMRNMRQFMSGMKNYLVKHGEREFEKEVEKERLKLKANEFLNLDAILENVMMSLVVRPLREHVYNLFVEHYASNDSIQTLVDSIQLAQSKPMQDFGVRPKIIPPTEASLNRILKYIERLQRVDSPFEKLENLLAAISAIVSSVKHVNSSRSVTLGADDLLPLLVWVLVRGKIIDAEIEAEYMWGLLHPSFLTGEGGYYLTTLSSAVHVLKTFKSSQGTTSTINGCRTPDCSSVLRILVPDELHGSLNTRILPIRPNMNTRDVCRILAHKIQCTNPQDYGLFKLVLGEETLLGDQECPQEMSRCLFAYKRIDAKIAWPKTANSASIFNC